MIDTYHLVLKSEIKKWEAKGWELINDNVHVRLGGWNSVYMRKVKRRRREAY